MSSQNSSTTQGLVRLGRVCAGSVLAACLFAATASGQIVDENFDSATGTGGVDILVGQGFNEIDGFDDGLTGEASFAGTFGDGFITIANAAGSTSDGVGGTGAAVLTVADASFTDGGWFASLFFPDIAIASPSLSSLSLQADIKTNVPNARYVVRLEGNAFDPFGLDQDFTDVLGGAPVTYFDNTSGPTGFTDNWDEGIAGEVAFAGLNGTATVSGGASVVGLTTGGVGGGGAGELTVTDIFVDPDSTWFAGVAFPDQQLPILDLSQIFLTGDIKGEANGGLVGDYQLRIEDQDIDFLTFKMTADGTFQSVGGPLSDAENGGVGIGDNIFDPTNGPFSVVVVFDNDSGDTWGQGGRLTFDNLFLTGGAVRSTIGSVTFEGVSDGSSFATVGGTLTGGSSTFDNVDESFSTVTETGGGTFFDNTSGTSGFTPGWDDGIEGEAAFAGFFGLVSVVGGASAEGIATGGNTGGAAVLDVTGLQVIGSCETSGWFAGLSWQGQIFPPGDLSSIFLRADVLGEAAPGGLLGLINLRIEDADQDSLNFVLPAQNGNFLTVGGPLSSAIERGGQLPTSDGMFDPTAGPFTVAVGFEEPCDTWDIGGKLTVDNVFLTSAPFGTGVDSYSIAVAAEGNAGNATWGTGGVLTLDNLSLTEVEVSIEPPLANDIFDVNGTVKSCANDAECAVGETGPTPQTVCRDSDGDGSDDACYVARQRYLSVKPNPNNAGSNYALRVSLDTGVAGSAVLGFVQAASNVSAGSNPGPASYDKATIDATPFYTDWTTVTSGIISIGDCEVSPGNSYIVQAINDGDDVGNESAYSLPLNLPTCANNGDVTGGGSPGDPPNGAQGSLVDVFAQILGFQSVGNEPLDWLDTDPATGAANPNLIVNLADAFAGVQAFQQNPYPGPAPLDCP
ncbi:MAG: hypothetical protein ACPGXK_01495 [Phycisphaerae bacterium]